MQGSQHSNDAVPAATSRPSRLRASAELVRLPNVFTAPADVLLGYLFDHTNLAPTWSVAMLVAASCSMYMAGMVLNDYFDFEVDARERPRRPLPSGRIERSSARRFGWALLLGGALLAAGVGLAHGRLRTVAVALALALCIVAYDGLLKRTGLAPWLMGACRALNLLLGMSLAAAPWKRGHALVAAAMFLYVSGLTWFARHEAQAGRRSTLIAGWLLMLLGLALWGATPGWLEPGLDGRVPLRLPLEGWHLLATCLAAGVLWRAAWAIVEPTPRHVQGAVRQAILSLVLFDAALVLLLRGWEYGLGVALLVLPALWLGRWIYST